MRVMSTNGKASNEIKINQWENNERMQKSTQTHTHASGERKQGEEKWKETNACEECE